MCKNGLNETHLKETLHMTHQTLELAGSWLHAISHQAGPGHLELAGADKLTEAEALLTQVRALLHEVDHSIAESEHTHSHGFEVELA